MSNMTISTVTFEIEFDPRHLMFKGALSSSSCLVLGKDDDDSSIESTFYGEDCSKSVVSFDDDYFNDDCSCSSGDSDSDSSCSSSSSTSSDGSSGGSILPSGRAIPRLFGDEDSIVHARRRSEQRASSMEQQDQEGITVISRLALLEGRTIEIPLKQLEGENDDQLFITAAAAAWNDID